ncbi:hypothetical protein BCU00_004115 [Vibrio breoganii]|uniref:hypothetical protein n=1 Tax=Vibrio breoganii TaxID=553239 RepID=UPI000C85B988|nr:hypothetical protein [Vibrio breoganii]PMK41235.1 hypothetical protein BCU00_14475 [Vibrio breoganii]
MAEKIQAEDKLNSALDRLLKGCPQRVKPTGKITLNKINNEAGFGNSYIHKFPEFVAYAKPLIEKFNINRDSLINGGLVDEDVVINTVEKLKAELKREKKLKEKYRRERDNVRKEKDLLEAERASLVYRLFEVQEEYSAEIRYLKGENSR